MLNLAYLALLPLLSIRWEKHRLTNIWMALRGCFLAKHLKVFFSCRHSEEAESKKTTKCKAHWWSCTDVVIYDPNTVDPLSSHYGAARWCVCVKFMFTCGVNRPKSQVPQEPLYCTLDVLSYNCAYDKRKYACFVTAFRQRPSHVIKLKETGGLNEDRGSPPQDTVRVGRGQCLNAFSLPLLSQRCGYAYGHTANKIRLQGGPLLASCVCICVWESICVSMYICVCKCKEEWQLVKLNHTWR